MKDRPRIIKSILSYNAIGALTADPSRGITTVTYNKLGTPTTGQPYKFNGKELITANGLNEYNFGARWYYSAVPCFTKQDPMAEKYPWLSPYLYCANNPVNAVDTDGNVIIFVNGFHIGNGGQSKYWNGIDSVIMGKMEDNEHSISSFTDDIDEYWDREVK